MRLGLIENILKSKSAPPVLKAAAQKTIEIRKKQAQAKPAPQPTPTIKTGRSKTSIAARHEAIEKAKAGATPVGKTAPIELKKVVAPPKPVVKTGRSTVPVSVRKEVIQTAKKKVAYPKPTPSTPLSPISQPTVSQQPTIKTKADIIREKLQPDAMISPEAKGGFVPQLPKTESEKVIKKSTGPTYSDVYSQFSGAQSNISKSITELKKPETYYDPTKNAITSDPFKALDPSAVVITSIKIKELEKAKTDIQLQKQNILKYEREGYQIEKTLTGDYRFFKTPEQVEQELVSAKKEQFRGAITGSPGQRLAGLGTWVTTGFLSFEDPFGAKSTFQAATGDIEGALETKARASIDLDKAIKEGAGSYVLKVATGPLAMTGTAFTIGIGLGAASGYAAGKIGTQLGAKALMAYKAGEMGMGAVFGGLAAHDVYKTYEEEGLPSAVGKATALGAMLGFGAAGYKAGKQLTYGFGARSGYRARVKKLVKTGEMPPEKGELYLKAERAEWALRKDVGKVDTSAVQKKIKIPFEKVETLKGKQGFKEFIKRHPIRRKAEIFGSATEGREKIHDIDVMYRNFSQAVRESGYAAKQTKAGALESLADIKKAQKAGEVVGHLGTRKQPSLRTKEGYDVMRWGESAKRHGESALELAHKGRTKDIMRSAELYKKALGSKPSPEAKLHLEQWVKLTASMEKDPLIMNPKLSKVLYQSEGLGSKISKFKNILYEKFAPESWAKKSFQKTMGIKLKSGMSAENILSGLPPSPSISPIGSIGSISGGLAAIGVSDIIAEKISPSISKYSPDISRSISQKTTPSVSKIASKVSPFVSPSIPPYFAPSILEDSPILSESIQPSPGASKSFSDSISEISESILESALPSDSPSIGPSVSSPPVSPSIIFPSISPSASVSSSVSPSISLSPSPVIIPGWLRGSLDLSSGTDMGFGFIDPFARERKHKVKNILEEMKSLGDFSL